MTVQFEQVKNVNCRIALHQHRGLSSLVSKRNPSRHAVLHHSNSRQHSLQVDIHANAIAVDTTCTMNLKADKYLKANDGPHGHAAYIA